MPKKNKRTKLEFPHWQRSLALVAGAMIIFANPCAAAQAGDAQRLADAPSSIGVNVLPAGSTFRDCPSCPQMTVIPAGQFLMGSSDEDIKRDIQEVPENFRTGSTFLTPGQLDYMAHEQPQHPVTIEHAFALGTYPVTLGEFEAFVHETGYQASNGCTAPRNPHSQMPSAGWQKPGWQGPGFAQSDQDPVVCVNWLDIQAYVNWLNSKLLSARNESVNQTRLATHYRLPSEAEWEYAARAGTKTTRWWGDAIGANNANCKTCGSEWDAKRTGPVGSLQANPFGLYDMLGNVFEWTNDCWNVRYLGAPSNGQPWTSGDCTERVTRGGSWMSDSWVVRSASRARGFPIERYNYVGFRVAKTIMNMN